MYYNTSFNNILPARGVCRKLTKDLIVATILLDTGVLDRVYPGERIAQQYDPEPLPVPVESVVYPSKHGNHDVPLISVGQGNMVVITAYSASGDESDSAPLADIYKVLLAEPPTPTITNSCGLKPLSLETKVLSRAKMCGWDLTYCKPMIVLDIPGVYAFEVIEDDLILTAVSHPIENYNYANLRG